MILRKSLIALFLLCTIVLFEGAARIGPGERGPYFAPYSPEESLINSFCHPESFDSSACGGLAQDKLRRRTLGQASEKDVMRVLQRFPENVKHETYSLVATLLQQFAIPVAHADSVRDASTLSRTTQGFLAKALEILVVINWLALSAVQALLDPDVIFGKIIDPATGTRAIEPLLRNMWITSRNIVNGIFGLLLLTGALMVIVTAGSENQGLSVITRRIPNFILAVVLVNFSWFFPRAILDMSNVLTATIYQLPALVDPDIFDESKRKCVYHPGNDGDPTQNDADGSQEFCRYVWKVQLFPTVSCPGGCPRANPALPIGNALHGVRIADFMDIFYQDWHDARKSGQCNPSTPMPPADDPCKGYNPTDPTSRIPISGGSAIINGLAVNFARMPALATIDFTQLNKGLDLSNNPFSTVTELLRFFVYLVFHIIFSGAIGLTLLAFAAVLVVRMGVLWLTIAFMPFMFVPLAMGHQWGEVPGEGMPNLWKKFLNYALLPAFVAVPYAIGFTLVSQLYFFDSLELNMGFSGFPLFAGMNDLQQLIWMILTIGVLWVGVFTALKKDEYGAAISKSISDFGVGMLKTVGTFAAYRSPGLPIPGIGRKSVGELYDMFKPSQLQQIAKFGGRSFDGDRTSAANVATKVMSEIKTSTETHKKFNEHLETLRTSSNDAAIKGALNELAKIIRDTAPRDASTQILAQDISTGRSRESLDAILNAARLPDPEKTAILSNPHVQQHFNIQMKFTGITAGMGDVESRKMAASQAEGYINSNVKLDRVVAGLEQKVRELGAQTRAAAGVQQVIDKLNTLDPNDKNAITTQLNQLQT